MSELKGINAYTPLLLNAGASERLSILDNNGEVEFLGLPEFISQAKRGKKRDENFARRVPRLGLRVFREEKRPSQKNNCLRNTNVAGVFMKDSLRPSITEKICFSAVDTHISDITHIIDRIVSVINVKLPTKVTRVL